MSEQTVAMRSFSWPIWAAIEGNGNPTREGMPALWADARRAFREAARCKNWCMAQIAMQDGAAKGGVEKLPPFDLDTKPIYGRARELFPHLDSQSLGGILRNVLSHYKRIRRSVWSYGSVTLPSYRDPQPVAFGTKDYDLLDLGDGRIGITLLLGLTGQEAEERTGKKRKQDGKGVRTTYTVELATGKDYHRHTELFHKTREGHCRRGAAVLRLGGRGDLMVSLPIEIPLVPSEQKRDRALLISTDPNALLVLTCQGFYGRQVPTFNEDWLRTKIRLHAEWRQRMSEDMRTNRVTSGTRRGMRRCLASRCDAQHRRITDRLHKVARAVANYAAAQHCGQVVFDGSCQAWVNPFPWHALKGLLADKLDEFAIPHAGLRDSDDDTVNAPTEEHNKENDSWHNESTLRLVENLSKVATAAASRKRPGKGSPAPANSSGS